MKKKFNRIYIEVGNICNLSCDFCPKTKRAKRQMTVSEFEYIVKSVSHLSDYFYLHLMGEPTFHPQLEQLLNVVEHFNKKAVIVTNGTLLNSVSDILLKSNAIYKVVISLHSFEANEIHKSFDEYLQGATNYAKLANQKTTQIVALRLWNLGQNGKNEQNDKVISEISNAFNYNVSDITPSQFSKDIMLAPNVYLQRAERFDWISDKSNDDLEKSCYALRSHFGILADGTVVPCCLDNDGDLALGNCFETDIDEILSSEKAMHIFNSFAKHTAPYERCKQCGYTERFSKKSSTH